MNCPTCRSPRLKPTKLAAGCGECRGALVALYTYRDWLERHPPEESLAAEAADAVAEDGEDYAEIRRIRSWLTGLTRHREILDYQNRAAGL